MVGRALTRARTRRSALRSLGAGSLGFLAALGGPSQGGYGPSETRARAARLQPVAQPNIILILTDDMRADDLAMMPAVQELLVSQGANFANFVATSPICAPARASILRGQYPHNHGMLRGRGKLGGFGRFHELGQEESTVATWLQDAGYRTGYFGKYLNGYPGNAEFLTYVPPGWDAWAAFTRTQVTSEETGLYFNYELNENGRLVAYGREPADYSTDVLSTKAGAFIRQSVTESHPFFAHLALSAPHDPTVAPPRYGESFADVQAPRVPSFDESDLSDKASWVRGAPTMTAQQVDQIDEEYGRRLRTLLAVDDLVASLIDTLETTGVLEHTYVVLSSDNGYHLGEHRIAETKGTAYEESIRVPLVVRGPGVPAGQTIPAVASQADLAPTFAAWADAAVPEFLDGRSLTPLFTSEGTPAWRQTALVELYASEKQGAIGQPGFNSVRGEDFIYIENLTGDRELYDLSQDPYQLENLANSANTDVIAGLSERLSAMATCAGAECRAIEDSPLPYRSWLTWRRWPRNWG